MGTDSTNITPADSALDATAAAHEVAENEHRGSASVQLSGPAVVASWVISLSLHAVVFVVMFLVPWLAQMITETDEVPLTRAELIGEVDGTAYAKHRLPEFNQKSQTEVEEIRFQPRKFDQLAQLGSDKKPELEIVGIGSGGGDFAQYGLQVGSGNDVQFFGVGASAAEARSVVYVVDMSGSMVDTFDAVRWELRRSISALRRSQKFHVIFFSNKTLEAEPRRLVSAIRAHKDNFFEFLKQVTPGGGTEPANAMERAFNKEPDIIFFLTDGEFDPALLERMRRWNREEKVRVFTIAYVSRDGAELLEKIAREHNGEFRYVSEDDLLP
jgi:hypothetical protein